MRQLLRVADLCLVRLLAHSDNPNVMTNTTRSLLWAVAGPAVSIFAAYVALFLLAFVVGPGMDMDNKGTPIQKLFGAAAFPAFYTLAVGGTLACWWVAALIFRHR